MSEKLTGSWKKHIDYRFLAGEDFGDKVVEMTISHVTKEESFNPGSKSKEKVNVLHFVGTTKGIIINAARAREITKVLGTDKYNEWEGKKVKFWGKPDNRFGQVVRVKQDYSNVKV